MTHQYGPGPGPQAGWPQQSGPPVPPASGIPYGRTKPRRALIIGVVVVAAVAIGVGLWLAFGNGDGSHTGVTRADVDAPIVVEPGHQPLPLSESPEDFVATFAAAASGGDVEWLLSRLHEVVLTRYGEDMCREYLQDYVVEPGLRLRVASVVGPGMWRWETDGRSTEIDEVYRIDAHRFADGVETTGNVEVANVDGTFRYFADCGSPRR